MAIYSCKGCEKRYVGCHSECPDYLAQKAEHDARKKEYDKKMEIEHSIYRQRSDKVYKAMQNRQKRRI